MSRFSRWLRRRDRDDYPRANADLQVCRACGADFVHPVAWTESGPEDWWLVLHCGGCDGWVDVVASNRVVAEYDRTLDQDMADITAEADRLEREWLAADAENFKAALRHYLLTADDFR